MKKALIIFTNYYPFYRGEEYLETELPILKSYFERILVIPTMVNKKMGLTRQVPAGVEVYRIENDCSVIGKIKMISQYSHKIIRSSRHRKEMRKECGLSIKRFLYYIYYNSRVLETTVKVRNFDFHDLKEKFDVTIYSYWMHAVASVALNIRKTVFKENPVRLICRGHRYDLYEDKNFFGYYPDRERILKHYTYVCPCSEDGRKYISIKHPGYDSKLKVKRLGTVDKGIAGHDNKEPVLLISCSSITRVKRLELIVDALQEVSVRGYRFKWVHFGDGSEGEHIKQLCRDKLNENYYEFKGHVANEVLLEIYKKSNPCLFINTSSSEGVPVSIMEAMSFGIPAAATNVGGTAELIVDKECGFILKKDFKTSELANIIISVIKMNSEDYDNLCKKSRERWNMISNAESVYNDFGGFLAGDRS